MGEDRQGQHPQELPGTGGTPPVEEQLLLLARWLRRQKKRLEKKKLRAEEEFAQAKKWETWQQEAELLRAHLHELKRGMREVVLDDWWTPGNKRTLLLDPAKTPKEEVESRFHRAKKGKRRLPHYQSLLQRMDEEGVRLDSFLEKSETIETEEALIQLQKEAGYTEKQAPALKEQSIKKSLPYREYRSEKGFFIWVGKKAADNEIVTFQLANGNDEWLHVADYAGSHVIIRAEKGQEIDNETIQDAMLLALFYSKARDQGEADITVTQRKHISRLRGGKSGQVAVGKYRTYSIRWQPDRWARLQSSLR